MSLSKAACIAHVRNTCSPQNSNMTDQEALDMYEGAQTLLSLGVARIAPTPQAREDAQQARLRHIRAMFPNGAQHLPDSKLYRVYETTVELLTLAFSDEDMRIPATVSRVKLDRWRKTIPGGEGMSYDEVYDAFEAEVNHVIRIQDRARAKAIVVAISPRVKNH